MEFVVLDELLMPKKVINMDFNPKKIGENFKSIQDFKSTTYHVRRCWQNCHICKTDFRELDPMGSVHMIILYSSETRFLCDNCNISQKDIPL